MHIRGLPIFGPAARRLCGFAITFSSVMLTACGGGGDDASPAPTTPAAAVDKYPLINTPTITGPLANEAYTSATKNYTFFASDVALASYGYKEEEFQMSGKANIFDAPPSPPAIPPTVNAAVVTADVPYKTRMVVRRPTDPARFNGTVVVEWLNVTDGFDGEYFWVQSKDYLLRAGYAYIGISAQNGGISNASTGLKAFSSARYSALDLTNGGTVAQDNLSYDVYSQALKAARNIPAVLNGMPVKTVIAAGMSQSGWRMGVYANSIHMRAPVADAFLIQVWNPALRDDLGAPVIKVLSETEATAANLAASQLDSPKRRTWWVAGSAHGDAIQRMGRNAVRLRDLGPSKTPDDAACGAGGATPTRSRTTFGHVVSAAVAALRQQVEVGTVPPSAPLFGKTGDALPVVARDSFGNALGAIRLATAEVPTARSNAMECGNVGAWVPFEAATLATLYPTHEAYVGKVTAAVNANVAAGFVLAEDGAMTIAAAQASLHGRGLQCGALCLSVRHYKANSSSTGLLRESTAYYATPRTPGLLEIVDEANLWVAAGYSTTGVAATYNFNLGAATLLRYIDVVNQLVANNLMTATAAEVLTNQASNIIRDLRAL